MAYDLIAGKQTGRDYSIGSVKCFMAEAGKQTVQKGPFVLLGIGAAIVGWFGQSYRRSHGKHGGLAIAGGAILAGASYYTTTDGFYRRAAGWLSGDDAMGYMGPRDVAIDAWKKTTGLDPEKVSIAVKEISPGKFGIATRDDDAKRFAYGTVDVTDLKNPKTAIDTDRKYGNVKETFFIFDKYTT